MDPYAQPCNTEHAYAQLFRCNNYLQVSTGYADPPKRASQPLNTNIQLPELIVQTEVVQAEAAAKRGRGRPRKQY